MVVAGEVSGDMYGALMVRGIKELAPGTRFICIGGDAMAAAGVELQVHINDLSVMGIWEVIRDVGRLRQILNRAKELLRRSKPDGLILIDFYRFNIELAREAKNLGIPVVYYVAPKLWVWGKGRIRHLKKNVDRILAIFPFEEEFFRSQGMPVSYVGNPLAQIMEESITGRQPSIEREDGKTVISILPGSRTSEVRHLLPPFLKTAQLLDRRLGGNVKFYVPIPQTISRSLVNDMLEEVDIEVEVVAGRSREILRISDVSLVASGTATLEAFLLGTPQVVAYKASWLSYFIGRKILRIKRFSLPNILAERDVVEEFLQGDVTPERLSGSAWKILKEGGPILEEYLRAGQEISVALKSGTASRLAARNAMDVILGETG